MDAQSDNGSVNESTSFTEAALPHGEAVMMVARGVGVLVAIAAMLFAILLMMVIRAIIGMVLVL